MIRHATARILKTMSENMAESSFVRRGGALRLSNFRQLELLRGLTERGKTLRTRVRGFSMEPFIRDGDIITVSAMNGRAPEAGEVVAFTQSGRRMAIHRIIAREGEGWLIQGDNSREADGMITDDRLLGRVTSIERAGRRRHLGLGGERRIIAWMVRHDVLPLFKTMVALPRRMAAAFLQRLQGSRLFRACVKRLLKNVRIVEATDEETAAVSAFFSPTEPILSGKPNPKVTNYIARHKTNFIGFIQLARHPEQDLPMTGHWLFSLMVRARYRGLGIGELLTRHVIDRSVLDGADELSLLVFEDNVRAISLYRKLGFKRIVLPAMERQLETEKIKNGRRRIAMRKPLRSNR
jgi:ribosomal protein S18 acetylase RimI-like enzyme